MWTVFIMSLSDTFLDKSSVLITVLDNTWIEVIELIGLNIPIYPPDCTVLGNWVFQNFN